jgi:hypothetical protein
LTAAIPGREGRKAGRNKADQRANFREVRMTIGWQDGMVAVLLESAKGCHYGARRQGENKMKQIRIGDVTIDAVIEREGPWRRPQDFFPAYDEGSSGIICPRWSPKFTTKPSA